LALHFHKENLNCGSGGKGDTAQGGAKGGGQQEGAQPKLRGRMGSVGACLSCSKLTCPINVKKAYRSKGKFRGVGPKGIGLRRSHLGKKTELLISS